MTNEEAIAYFKERNKNLVSVAKDENVYDYEKQIIETDCMRRTFEANEKAIKALEQQPCEDCISRQKALDCFEQTNTRQGAKYAIETLPPVTPKYTDEEIDKAQAVEQAYVDKMVELAVEETKERYSDAIEKMKKTIDEMTEIHSDGEFYIKNVDAKWIIIKYLCGGEEDEETKEAD